MIELTGDTLQITFPEVHRAAVFGLDFQRTLRIPDDGRTYPLPPGLGLFPVRHVDDYAKAPQPWKRHGGVMLPMYQSEALWLNFRPSGYPFAVKVAAGKINAVTGESWSEGLMREPQNYLVVPNQPWLDGYCVEKGTIRQFVAMPLGTNYSPEAQLTGKEVIGGLQVEVFPLKAEAYERWRRESRSRMTMAGVNQMAPGAPEAAGADMSLGMGGSMHQDIAEDTFDFADWDLRHKSRCFVHLCNSMTWREITGEPPPTTPFTAREYSERGLPWFDYYHDGPSVDGGGALGKLKSIVGLGKDKGTNPIPDNEPVHPKKVVDVSRPVRDGDWWSEPPSEPPPPRTTPPRPTEPVPEEPTLPFELKFEIPVPGMATARFGRLGDRLVLAAGIFPTGESGPGRVRVWECDSGGRVSELLSIVPESRKPLCIEFGDVDGDGQGELVVGTGDGDNGGRIYVYRADGSLYWESEHIGSLRRESEIAVGDVDGDGADEIAVAVNWYGRYVTLYDHVGRGRFTKPFTHKVGDGHSVAVGDVDGDGLPEIVYGLGAHDGRILVYDYQRGEYVRTLETKPYGSKRAYVTTGRLFESGRDQIVVAWGKVDDGHLTVLDDGEQTHHAGPFCSEEQKVPATYPVVADVWNDGTKAVVFRLIDRPHHGIGVARMIDRQFGQLVSFFPEAEQVGRPLVADVDGDGKNELVVPERRGDSYRLAVYQG